MKPIKFVVITPAGTKLEGQIPGEVMNYSVVEFFEYLFLTYLPETLAIDLTRLTKKQYLSHAFWMNVDSVNKEVPPGETKLFLNDNESVKDALSYLYGKPLKIKSLSIQIGTNEQNVFISTIDEGLKPLEIPTCQFAINKSEALMCAKKAFLGGGPPGYGIVKDDSEQYTFFKITASDVRWSQFRQWTNSDRHIHLFYLPEEVEDFRELIPIKKGFVWEGTTVVDRRKCVFKCKPKVGVE